NPCGEEFVFVAGETTSTDFWFPSFGGGVSDGFAAQLAVTLGGCTGTGFGVGPTTATPATVAPGQTETVVANVCSGQPASNIHVDLEIHDAGGQFITQHILDGQTFAAG